MCEVCTFFTVWIIAKMNFHELDFLLNDKCIKSGMVSLQFPYPTKAFSEFAFVEFQKKNMMIN